MSNSRHENEQAMGVAMKRSEDLLGDTVVIDNEDGIVSEFDWRTFKLLRRMRDVKRLAGFFTTRVYTDAEHCYYTGLLFMAMARAHGLALTTEQIAWVFCHDAMEVATGDLLYPVKNASAVSRGCWDTIEAEVAKDYPALEKFTDSNGREILGDVRWDLFKDCDSLELWLCCTEERNRSNDMRNLDGSTVEATMYRNLVKSKFEFIRKTVAHSVEVGRE